MSFLHRCDCFILRESAIDRVRGLEINFVVVMEVFKLATSGLSNFLQGVICFIISNVEL